MTNCDWRGKEWRWVRTESDAGLGAPRLVRGEGRGGG